MRNQRATYYIYGDTLKGQIAFFGLFAIWIYQFHHFWNTGKMGDKVFLIAPAAILLLAFFLCFRSYMKTSVNSKYIEFEPMFPAIAGRRLKVKVPLRACKTIFVDYSSSTSRFNYVTFIPLDGKTDYPSIPIVNAGLAQYIAESLQEEGYSITVERTNSGHKIHFNHT